MCAVLYDAANRFIHEHFVEVSMSEEFLALAFDEVLELVARDELNVKAEEQVRPPECCPSPLQSPPCTHKISTPLS